MLTDKRICITYLKSCKTIALLTDIKTKMYKDRAMCPKLFTIVNFLFSIGLLILFAIVCFIVVCIRRKPVSSTPAKPLCKSKKIQTTQLQACLKEETSQETRELSSIRIEKGINCAVFTCLMYGINTSVLETQNQTNISLSLCKQGKVRLAGNAKLTSPCVILFRKVFQ